MFVVLVSSYLLVLSAKKDRVDDLVNNIEDEYKENLSCNTTIKNISFPYNTINEGIYIFNITDSSTNTSKDCEVQLEKDVTIEYKDGNIKINNSGVLSDITFDTSDCNNINTSSNIASINKVTYNCD